MLQCPVGEVSTSRAALNAQTRYTIHTFSHSCYCRPTRHKTEPLWLKMFISMFVLSANANYRPIAMRYIVLYIQYCKAYTKRLSCYVICNVISKCMHHACMYIQESWAIAKMTARCALYGCPEKYRESLSMSTATFPEIYNELLFRLFLWMWVQNLKFVALPIFEIIGVLKKFGQFLDSPTLPFLKNF